MNLDKKNLNQDERRKRQEKRVGESDSEQDGDWWRMIMRRRLGAWSGGGVGHEFTMTHCRPIKIPMHVTHTHAYQIIFIWEHVLIKFNNLTPFFFSRFVRWTCIRMYESLLSVLNFIFQKGIYMAKSIMHYWYNSWQIPIYNPSKTNWSWSK